MEASEQCTASTVIGAQRRVVAVAVAFGTRGDVQPVALLAHQLACSCPAALVTLITHSCHQEWLDTQGLRLHMSGLPTAPARVWWQQDAGSDTPCAPPQCAPPRDWDAVLQACCSALDCIGPMAAHTGTDNRHPPGLLIFNLFALEAYHIGEALQVPCVAAAPYAIPYAMPATFRRRFAALHPELYSALQAAGGTGTVSWAEVQHWMWPLFTERWQAWRQQALGLCPVPLMAACGDAAQGAVQGMEGRRTGWKVRAVLPPATPLLYGFSEHIVPRPNYYPSSVHVCGFWLPQATLHARVNDIISAACGGMSTDETGASPVCIDFGSMGRMGLIPDAGRLLQVVAGAVAKSHRHAVVLAGGWQPLQIAYSHMDDQEALRSKLTVVMEPVPHPPLLERCCAFVHHGGSGSTAAALAAGTPQVIAPFMFDQHFWAERLSYMGLAPPPLDHQLLFGTASAPGSSHPSAEHQDVAWTQQLDTACAALHSRLVFALSPNTQQSCRDVAQALAQEDGLAKGVGIIHTYLQSCGAGVEQLHVA